MAHLKAIFMSMIAPHKSSSFVAAPKPEAALPPELDPGPVLLTPPELVGREREHIVIRHDDDTDHSYAARCDLVALILGAAQES